ncbi:hypothetical protein BDK51DRAFT_39833 [Blyttiomyces helicus]|uniref:Uncharacterized protein n=1 Tax=Blyttiomyces helicus TaxID=388810 RepID=A0A4P9W869_9FUNG|nr:hypothetical protein BDK51DRAFT_39833 [Blyttiomyces helicus]|eukprot:RKO88709.1 hypothetical protein BDK51DRAFT_39833 [Blyttiomyces helicus]
MRWNIVTQPPIDVAGHQVTSLRRKIVYPMGQSSVDAIRYTHAHSLDLTICEWRQKHIAHCSVLVMAIDIEPSRECAIEILVPAFETDWGRWVAIAMLSVKGYVWKLWSRSQAYLQKRRSFVSHDNVLVLLHLDIGELRSLKLNDLNATGLIINVNTTEFKVVLESLSLLHVPSLPMNATEHTPGVGLVGGSNNSITISLPLKSADAGHTPKITT